MQGVQWSFVRECIGTRGDKFDPNSHPWTVVEESHPRGSTFFISFYMHHLPKRHMMGVHV